jgi:transposase
MITNRNEIHRRRVKWLELRQKGFRTRDIAMLYSVAPSTVTNGVRRVKEMLSIYGEAVLAHLPARNKHQRVGHGKETRQRVDIRKTTK